MVRSSTVLILHLFFAVAVFSNGCASGPNHGPRAATILQEQYAKNLERLELTRLTNLLPKDNGRSERITIMVHPAYSVFYDSDAAKYCPGPKCSLIRKQLDNEARYIKEEAARGSVVVLVLPADPTIEAGLPARYAAYLNSLAGRGRRVFYVFSRTASNGALLAEDMLALYSLITALKTELVLIGGGYIGRCQKEFYSQIATYFDKSRIFLVPEISTVSPADISEKEARDILSGIRRHEYSIIEKMISKKTEGPANVLSISKGTSAGL